MQARGAGSAGNAKPIAWKQMVWELKLYPPLDISQILKDMSYSKKYGVKNVARRQEKEILIMLLPEERLCK